jgi:hypothetical protein
MAAFGDTRRPDRCLRIEAREKALMGAFGDDAYTEARQSEGQADTEAAEE